MITINLSDLHFGAFDPKRQFEILINQCLLKIKDIPFDIFCIQGDIFDKKFMANNDAIMYACLFIQEALNICNMKNALLLIISGTSTHDADQIKLLYHFINGNNNISIVESVSFVTFKNYRILCIPELYNMSEDVYTTALFNSGVYDMAILHGTVKNSIYGADTPTLNSNQHPIFDISHFYNCKGPIMCGHVHTPTCLQQHIYYTGCPYRWKFGEEEQKGFMIVMMDDITYKYFVHFEEIESDIYNSFNYDNIIGTMPVEDIINNIKLLSSNGENIKIKFTIDSPEVRIIKEFFKTNPRIKIDAKDINYRQSILDIEQEHSKNEKYNFLLDSNLSPEEKIVQYINMEEGRNVISTEQFTNIMREL